MEKTNLILVVDDNFANLEVISEALTNVGYEVAIATDGERAIKQVQYSQPDLILLDIMMPKVNGFETCKWLKSNADTCDIPVIYMTALSDVENRIKGLKLGAVDYITKPFQEEEVLARISTHLQLRSLTKDLEKKVEQRTVELSQALHKLQASQMQLVQQEKMSALGQLITGVAHEINNPVGFIAGNLEHAETYFKDLINHLNLYQQKSPPDEEISKHAEEIGLDYVVSDLSETLVAMKRGTEQILYICNSLSIFSRSDYNRKIPFDIHDGIDSTILILKHRLKGNSIRPAILVIKNYSELPQIDCFPGQLNQVFMNIIVNAIDALEESNKEREFSEIEANPNRITIQTDLDKDGDHALIKIEDNGIGMSDDVQQKIFDYLFTTKPVGQGTGLGLSIAHQTVVEKHGGSLQANSTPGKGTEFVIRLPIKKGGSAAS